MIHCDVMVYSEVIMTYSDITNTVTVALLLHIIMAGRPRKSSKHWLFRRNAGKLPKIIKTKFPSPVDTVSSHDVHHLLLDSTGKSADIPSSSSSSPPSSPPCYNLRPVPSTSSKNT